jgi:hypothetical protein
MNLIRKPNPWFTIYMLTTPFLFLFSFLHILTLGMFDGQAIVNWWTVYTVNKDIKVAKENGED